MDPNGATLPRFAPGVIPGAVGADRQVGARRGRCRRGGRGRGVPLCATAWWCGAVRWRRPSSTATGWWCSPDRGASRPARGGGRRGRPRPAPTPPGAGQAGVLGGRAGRHLEVLGDCPDASTDSRHFGAVPLGVGRSAGPSTGTAPRAAPALWAGPRSTIGPDAQHPGQPEPPPRPELPRRRRRPVGRRHPADACRVPGGGGLPLLPAPPHPGPDGHRARLHRTPGGLRGTRPVQRGRQPRRDPGRSRTVRGPRAEPGAPHPGHRRDGRV